MSILDENSCYKALKTHDARFDGRFFTGVTSTGIYCRPICAVKVPKQQNCRFFSTAAAAEAHGFRPCLRCRPELAPGHSHFDRSNHISQVAAALIEEGFLEENNLAALASHFGITDRHLRRIFRKEFGVPLIEYVQTQRLLLAKRLLTDTALPVTEIALASGFSSLRRFNDSFKNRYRLKPTDLRKKNSTAFRSDAFQFDLAYRPPYHSDAILAFLAARTIAGVEAVQDGHYIRSVAVQSKNEIHTGWIDISFHAEKHTVRAIISSSLSRVIPATLFKIKQIFDLSCDPLPIELALASFKGVSGLRVPGAFDGFELAVRAILGQQISVKAAHTIAGRIASRFGKHIETPYSFVNHVFPSAETIAGCSPADFSDLGVANARCLSIISLAKAIAVKKLFLHPTADVAATIATLQELPGIGEWTAQYIAMRALSWPDAFPHTDLGIKKALNENNINKILKISESWRPWRSYAVIALWQSLTKNKKNKRRPYERQLKH